ncbi:type II toxin-antitoxin system RelB/DinJ family antitoxin [Candidatus Uhrbacteria bacterium]|nr:type II toxin-antitoxin system RelB/DinJ family antitoxin [Candidatus Uhrbacteria bacterium]
MKTILNIKTDKEVKEGAQGVAREMGVPLSTIVNAYLKEFIRTREIRLVAPPKMTPHLEKVITAAKRDYKKKKNISPVFSRAQNAIAYLHSK